MLTLIILVAGLQHSVSPRSAEGLLCALVIGLLVNGTVCLIYMNHTHPVAVFALLLSQSSVTNNTIIL